jgi:hypothetical protein
MFFIFNPIFNTSTINFKTNSLHYQILEILTTEIGFVTFALTMRKEVLTAIFIGVTIGSIVTYGIYIANTSLSNKVQGIDPKTTMVPTPSPSAEPAIELAIHNPQDNIVVNTPTVLVEGTANRNAIISIISDNEDYLIEANENGYFSQQVTLVKGANTINISASDTNKLSSSKTLYLVYTTEIDVTKTDSKESTQ